MSIIKYIFNADLLGQSFSFRPIFPPEGGPVGLRPRERDTDVFTSVQIEGIWLNLSH